MSLSFSGAARENLRNKPWLKWAIAVTASLGALLEVIDVSIVNVALSDIQSTLGATLSEVGWVITGYAMANVVIIPLSAWLGSYFGKKRYFVFSMAAFVAASVLCGAAASLPVLVAARIAQGLAGGGLLAKAQAILFETFPPEEHGIAQAVFGIGVIVGPTIGPTLGGYLTTNFSWPWIFFVNVPVGIVGVLMALVFLPDDPKKRSVSSRVDWTGIGLLAVTLGSLQWLLERGNEEDWFESKFITGLGLTSLAAGVLFIWRELKVAYPAVNLRVLKTRALAFGSLFSSVLGMGLYGALFAVPIFTQQLLHFTAVQTGFLLLPGALMSALMMPLMGRLVGRIDARVLITMGGSLTVGVMMVLASINSAMGADDFFWPLVFRGIGVTMMFLPLSVATLGSVPTKMLPAASGFYNLTRQLGGSIGIAVLTTVLSQREAVHYARLSDHVTAFSQAARERMDVLTAAFVARGSDAATASQQAVKALAGTVRAQASVMAFADVFRFVAWVFLAALPLVFFLGKGRGTRSVDAH